MSEDLSVRVLSKTHLESCRTIHSPPAEKFSLKNFEGRKFFFFTRKFRVLIVCWFVSSRTNEMILTLPAYFSLFRGTCISEIRYIFNNLCEFLLFWKCFSSKPWPHIIIFIRHSRYCNCNNFENSIYSFMFKFFLINLSIWH